MSDDVRELLDRGVAGVSEVDLVPGALVGARARQRRRRVGVLAGGTAGAAAMVLAIALGGSGGREPSAVDPAASTSSQVATLTANQRFLDEVSRSGIAVDYQPLASPAEAMASPMVVTGRVTGAELERVSSLGDRRVRVRVDVSSRIPGGEFPEAVEFTVGVGGRFDLTPEDLDAVRGPVLLVLADVSEQLPVPGEAARVTPYVDGIWFDVPQGLDGPYADYPAVPTWPAASSVEELAAALKEVEPAASAIPDPTDPAVASEVTDIAVRMEESTSVDNPACQARLLLKEGLVSWAWVHCSGLTEDGIEQEKSVPVRVDGNGLHVPGEGHYADYVRAQFPADLAAQVLANDERLLPTSSPPTNSAPPAR